MSKDKSLEDKLINDKYLSKEDVNRLIDAGKTYGGQKIGIYSKYLVMLKEIEDKYLIQSCWKYNGENKK